MSEALNAIEAAQADAAERHAPENLSNAGIVLRDWCEFMENEPPKWDWIIQDVIAHGMKGDLNAKSKQWKSFFGIQLALAVSSGKPFLGMCVPCPRRTAYFNLELMERGAWERGATMTQAAGGAPGKGMLYIANLRGKADRLRDSVKDLVAEIKRLGIDLVILDPRYKLIGDGEDENSAAGLRGVLEFRDALTPYAAVLMIGHDPKGSTEGKSVSDRGAGSYTAGADYDFSFALSPHEEEGASVLSTSCRYRKSPDDLTVRFDPDRQIFNADRQTPPAVKVTRRGGAANTDPKEKAARKQMQLDALEKAVVKFAGENDLMSMGLFRQKIGATPEGAAFSRDTLRVAIDTFIERGLIAKTPEKVRKENGEVKQSKSRTILAGSLEAVKKYDEQFKQLPL